MRTKVITYSSIFSILLILLIQAYVIYCNFQLTIEYTTREIDYILNEALKEELDIRQESISDSTELAMNSYQNKKDEDIELNSNDFILSDDSKNSFDNNDISDMISTVINECISEKIPLNLHVLDSITNEILKQHNINSEFSINLFDYQSNKIINSSKEHFSSSIFLIHSKHLLLDTKSKNSLQLVLINPLALVIKKMGILLLSSLILSLLGFYGLWFLHQTLTRQKKLMEVKNDFFGNTAHELKRPVAQLHLALDALSKPVTKENVNIRERYLKISKEATKDMSEKITMIMTLAMAEEGIFKLNYSNFNLLDEVHKVKEQFTSVIEKKPQIILESNDQSCYIAGDKDHLMQCIANLLDNAIKYSGNSVNIIINLQRLQNSLRLSVKDDGIGIEPDKTDRIFEKYIRLQNGEASVSGFGIGLSYVKAVIEKHAGNIEVKSSVGKGSEFIINLPLNK
ncbi:MAG: HAMP domain-containing sensor histidine kinase [Paludibacter sp.]|nr:HAMP domain-containing sensor histidine kinase [Paludibacter sp.]